MDWLRMVSINIFLINLSHSLNPLLTPVKYQDTENKWPDNLLFEIVKLLNKHRVQNQYQNNDLAFLQFGNDSTGFIDQLFVKYYGQFNDRAIIITRVPLLKDDAVLKTSSLMVVFMCNYDKKEFQKFLKEIQLSVFWYSVQPILVVPTFPIAIDTYNWLKHMFSLFKYEYMFNVGIIYYSRLYDRIERIAYNPFASDPIVIEPKHLFANKVKNLNGYELKITQYDDPPRSVFGEDDRHVNGMDGLALYTVCQQLNASCRVMKAAGGPETSYSNVIFDLVTRRADINFNHRIFWSKNYLNSVVIPIYPYEHENIVLMVPAAQVVMPYRHFIDAYKQQLWLIIAFNFIGLSAILFAVNTRHKVSQKRGELISICLDLVRMHLAQPLPRLVTRERQLFWLISMYTFVVFQAYQTKLTSFLMSRRYMPNYQMIAEVNDSNLELVCSKNYQVLVNHFLDMNPMKNKQLDIDFSIWRLREVLLEKNEDFDQSGQAFFVTHQEAELFKYSYFNKIHDDYLLEPIKEKVLASVASYTVLKNSPFEKEISNVIRRVHESGLYQYFKVLGFWDVRRHFNLTTQTMMQVNTRPVRVQLSVRVFMPILHMLGAGMVVSIICFLLEYLTPCTYNAAKWISRRIGTWHIKATLKRWFY